MKTATGLCCLQVLFALRFPSWDIWISSRNIQNSKDVISKSMPPKMKGCPVCMTEFKAAGRQHDLSHPQTGWWIKLPLVDGSPSYGSEVATSFQNAAAHRHSYIWGIYAFLFLPSFYKPSRAHEPLGFDRRFPKLCQQSVSEHVVILYNPGNFTKGS